MIGHTTTIIQYDSLLILPLLVGAVNQINIPTISQSNPNPINTSLVSHLLNQRKKKLLVYSTYKSDTMKKIPLICLLCSEVSLYTHLFLLLLLSLSLSEVTATAMKYHNHQTTKVLSVNRVNYIIAVHSLDGIFDNPVPV